MSEVLALAGDEPIAVLSGAKADLMAAFEPVPNAESERHDGWRKALGSRLDPIGAKIAPTMSTAQAAAWRKAMTDALVDVPALIGLSAAKRALHRPISFISEVDGVIREIAAEISEARRDAISRLERFIAEMERANEPALPAPVEEPADPVALGEMIGGIADPELKRVLRKIATGAGWIDNGAAAPS